MKHFSRKALVGAAGVLAAVSAHAAGTNPMSDIFAAVDLTTVAAFVGTAGVAIIGIAMAFKGITLGKRTVNKA